MRIVHLVIDGDVAGGQMVALQLARASRKYGDRVSFVAPTAGTFVELAKADGFDIEIIELRRSFHLGALFRLRTLLRREGVDVLHTHTLAGAAIPARVAARMAGVTVVSHMHARETFRHGLAGSLLRRIDAHTARPGPVISVSPQLTESLLERGYDATGISTIPNGVELPAATREIVDLRPGLGIAAGTPIVLSVGRLDEAKGQLDLIEAASLLAERGVSTTVVLVGTDPHGGAYEARLRKRAAERGVADRVVFAGFRSDVGALLDGADVVVLPSHSEGVSLVLLEAMAHARPVVATAVGGTPTVAEDGTSALLVPPHDPSALAAALERLLSDKGLAAELGRAARKRVGIGFALSTSIRRVLELYARAPEDSAPATRIAILTEIPSPYRIPLFNALEAREDVEPVVLFLAEHDPTHPYPFYAEELRVAWRVLPGRALLGRRWIVLSRGVARALMTHKADVVVVGGWNQPAFWAAAAWCRLRRRPLVAWVESTTRDRRTEAGGLEAAKRVFLGLCSGFLVPGRASTDYLRALGVPAASIRVAPNAVDPSVFGTRVAERRVDREALRARLGLTRPTVLSVGRLEHDKGMDVLVRAMRDVPADLVIVGGGSMENVLRREAGENVRFAGRLERDDLVDWYAAADVFALASRSDQWGMVLNEAALAGLPLVATEAVGAAHDLIEPGRNGAIVQTESSAELARALSSLLADDTALKKAGRASKAIVARFTPEAWAAGAAAAAHAVSRRRST
jgi:glycosyltransferase involved in cell wall biosynthesis